LTKPQHGVGVCVIVGVFVGGSGVNVFVGGSGVFVGGDVFVGVGVTVAVNVAVGQTVGHGVAVGVAVDVGVPVGVDVGTTAQLINSESTMVTVAGVGVSGSSLPTVATATGTTVPSGLMNCVPEAFRITRNWPRLGQVRSIRSSSPT